MRAERSFRIEALPLLFALAANAAAQSFVLVVLPALGRDLGFSPIETGLLLGLAAPEPLRIDDLVTADDVRTITGFNDDLRAEALVGQATGPQYNSLHLERADGQLGFTLQVWLPGELRLARDQFERLRRTAFSEAQRVEAGNEAFTSETPTSIELTLVDYRSGAVIILGCARGLCNPSHLIRLSSLVVSRLAGSE